jgi:hypothetical protein
MSLSLSNVIRVTILSALRGLPEVNTSMLGLITDEVPIPTDFGTFRAYKDPGGVATDFGTNSETYRIAVKVFSQTPNILTGGGSLLVIPRLQSAPATQATIVGTLLVDFTQLTSDDYSINLDIDGGGASDIAIGELDLTDLSTIEASLNSTAIQTAGVSFSLSGEISKAKVTLKSDATGATSGLVVGSLAGTGTDIAPLLGLSGTASGADAGIETIKDCILRTINYVPYFGLCYNEKMSDANLTEVANLIQAYDILQFVGSNLQADIAGIFTTLLNSGLTKTRMLYYSNSENDALDFSAGYASRGLSVNFSGTNTSLTMNLKEITGLPSDPEFETTSAQTRYDELKLAGVDCYSNFGVEGVSSFGVNKYFDEIYIELAFKLQLQIAGFNYLKQTPFKIPQTQDGVEGLKGAYRKVCQRFVTNGSYAPGTWLGSVFFGNPEDHIRNIAEFGYWIYSLPISEQSSTDRSARIAPLIQIACKSSGAIHSSDALVYIER